MYKESMIQCPCMDLQEMMDTEVKIDEVDRTNNICIINTHRNVGVIAYTILTAYMNQKDNVTYVNSNTLIIHGIPLNTLKEQLRHLSNEVVAELFQQLYYNEPLIARDFKTHLSRYNMEHDENDDTYHIHTYDTGDALLMALILRYKGFTDVNYTRGHIYQDFTYNPETIDIKKELCSITIDEVRCAFGKLCEKSRRISKYFACMNNLCYHDKLCLYDDQFWDEPLKEY
ncbi:hypothetical protein ASJ82_07630 [Methanosphaera cuniculi]|uniref:Uncharacterized protein n=1 Tax=Methanosphaera cuniculi TaxID=1077256 RepID=A0A2A2HDY2_9EURY|nr:hypothetical protein ASJ82_07630 [Methanosphaera cuniculi]